MNYGMKNNIFNQRKLFVKVEIFLLIGRVEFKGTSEIHPINFFDFFLIQIVIET